MQPSKFIDDDLLYYIENNYLPQKKSLIYRSLFLINAFDVKDWQNKYLELIYRQDSLESYTKDLDLIALLAKDLLFICKSHLIEIDEDIAQLQDLEEIVAALYLYQNLQDYSWPLYIISNEEISATERFMHIVAKYSKTTIFRLMQVITSVDEKLLKAMTELAISQTEQEQNNPTQANTTVQDFIEFTKGTASLGVTLYKDGYSRVTIEELINLVNIPSLINKTNIAQVALDVLSILLICQDTQDTIATNYDKYIADLIPSEIDTLKVKQILLNMLSDFVAYRQSKKLIK